MTNEINECVVLEWPDGEESLVRETRRVDELMEPGLLEHAALVFGLAGPVTRAELERMPPDKLRDFVRKEARSYYLHHNKWPFVCIPRPPLDDPRKDFTASQGILVRDGTDDEQLAALRAVGQRRGQIEDSIAAVAGFMASAKHWNDVPPERISEKREELRALCIEYVSDDLVDALQKSVTQATGKRCTIKIETYDIEPTQARALELIREAFEPREGPPRIRNLAELVEGMDDPEDNFRSDVVHWYARGQRAQRAGWDFNEAWYAAFKPWLQLIVGWRARSELGRLAGEEGYNMLHRRLEDLWKK